MKRLILHSLLEKKKDRYTALCLELDVATEGRSIEEAKANLKEAVLGYLEDVVVAGDEKDFIPRPAPLEEWIKFFRAESNQLKKQLEQKQWNSIKLEEVIYA